MSALRVATWNMAQGAFRKGANAERWDYLRSLKVDVALIQEAVPPPESDRACVVWPEATPDAWQIGRTRSWGTAIALFNGDLRLEGIPLLRLGDTHPAGFRDFPPSALWTSHPGAMATGLLHGLRAKATIVVSIYGLMDDPVLGAAKGCYATTSLQRLLSDLTPLLDGARKQGAILGGDLNIGTQAPAKDFYQPHHRAVFDRLRSLGFVDCLWEMVGPDRGPLAECPCGPQPDCRHVRTQRHSRSKRPWQNDYLFVTEPLRKAVTACAPQDEEAAWALSDHCPVIAELDI